MINKKNGIITGPSTFLGSSSNLNLLLEQPEDGGSFHYALPEEITLNSSRTSDLNNEEIEILKFRGAFLLPPRDLCDDIVEAFFEKIHPNMPFLNRSQFMRRYNDPANPPSLLLLQSVLLAGSRVCKNPALLDASGSADLASLTFYKRAKALFDANYEPDRMTIVQSVMLMSWWWEGAEDVTKNSFYWSRVALSIAQGFGLHRSMDNTNMPLASKRTWKRMWWSVFQRDRWVAVSLGRPVVINLEDSDVPMLTEDDFNEDEPGYPSLYPVNRVNILYFIHAVKLSEIMGLVLRQQFSVNAENSRRQNKIPVVSHCDMAMGSWMNNLPPELKYSVKDKTSHNYFKSILHAQYYTVLCLVHRSNILRKGYSPKNPYPSWGIAFQAAHMISRIFENLLYFDECQDCGAFYVYTLSSAMIMLLYQTETVNASVVESAKKALATCSRALEELGRMWSIARMILKLFRQLHQNKNLREKFVNEVSKRPYETAILKGLPVKKTKTKAKSGIDKDEWTFDSNQYSTTNSKTAGLTSSGIPYVQADQLTAGSRDALNAMNGAQRQEKVNKTWQQATSSFSQPPSGDNSSFDGNNASGYDTPEFFMVTNKVPSNQKFYSNFQPSQLFPETSPGGSEGEVFTDELLMNLGMGALQTTVSNNGNSVNQDDTPPEVHPHDSAANTPNLRDWYQSVSQRFQSLPGAGDYGMYPDLLGMSLNGHTDPNQM